jgi:hypothetical protein
MAEQKGDVLRPAAALSRPAALAARNLRRPRALASASPVVVGLVLHGPAVAPDVLVRR